MPPPIILSRSEATFLQVFILLALIAGIIFMATINGEKVPPAARIPRTLLPATVPMDRSGQKPTIPLSAITIGNHSHVVLNLPGEPSAHAVEILRTLDDFERQHPDREVTSWVIDEKPGDEGANAYIFGLWINHRSRAGNP